jgi:hypothetical protein
MAEGMTGLTTSNACSRSTVGRRNGGTPARLSKSVGLSAQASGALRTTSGHRAGCSLSDTAEAVTCATQTLFCAGADLFRRIGAIHNDLRSLEPAESLQTYTAVLG